MNHVASRSELRMRVLTAAALIITVVAALYWLPTLAVAALLGVFALGGAWEWSTLAGCRRMLHRQIYLALTLILMLGFYVVLDRSWAQLGLWGLALAWWMVSAVLVLRYQLREKAPGGDRMWRLAAGWLMVVPAWAALVVLHYSHGAGGVLALLLLVWVADIAAYLFGSRFGRRRLASRVSQGKSWEGLLAALAAASLVAVSTAVWVGIRPEQRMLYVVLAATVVAVSVLGDLTESLFKRVAGVKDSGSVLPGHGGVLDRIDSLTAAAPAFVFGLHWLEGSA